MRGSRPQEKPVCVRALILLVLFVSLQAIARGEQLPVRTYTTAEGLPSDYIQRIVRDSHGFLWFCTFDGLSRFNGYEFTTYGVEQGLPHPQITDLLETRRGVYWVATNGGGVCRFNPAPAPSPSVSGGEGFSPFTGYPVGDEQTTNRVNVLCEDHAGRIWAGTDAGLFCLDETDQAMFRRVALNLPDPDRLMVIRAMVEDAEGSLWLSTDNGLVRRLPDGRTVRYSIWPSQYGDDLVASLLYDREGRLWVGHRDGGGLIVFKPEPAALVGAGGALLTRKHGSCCSGTHSQDKRLRLPLAPGEVCRFTIADGLDSNNVWACIYESSDGRIWIRNGGGLTEFSDGRFRSYTKALALGNTNIWSVIEDRDRNLWLGTLSGATKITWSGFSTFGKADGLIDPRINAIIENRRGDLCAITSEGGIAVNRFDGRRFSAGKFRFPAEIKGHGWGGSQVTFQDHNGEWWVPTTSGLCRFPRVMDVDQFARTRPKAVYNQRRGDLPGNDVIRLFEDSRGDVWISIASNVRSAAVRWDRATESFHAYSEEDGLPPFSPPTAYCEDSFGNLWLGFYNGGLARYRGGRFQLLTGSDGVPAGLVRSLYLDRAGRLWIATDRGGVARLDDSQAEHPGFVAYTIRDGLSSNSVFCITEDRFGRMYFGTARSLDRLDLGAGHLRHYARADGLANNSVHYALRDRQGALWFGTDLGLSRFVPAPDAPVSPPPILISGLRIAGTPYPISALGEIDVSGIVLNSTKNQMSIDFVGLGFGAGEVLQYQYRLSGTDSEWSTPGGQRTINYAGLPPGRYEFLVRAMTAGGETSATPARVKFTILPPIWQRWWFLALAGAAAGLMLWSAYRYRVGRLIELERVRTRIATDLHDDIGSSLSQVALLSEVVRRCVGRDDNQVTESLRQIAGLSRELVDSMSDIVWAVDPRKDHLSDLAQRMRRFASEVFTARDVELGFSESAQTQDTKLKVDVRRQVFLIFKESVNNAVRHSGCRHADIDFQIAHGWLTLRVSDNGIGFDSSRVKDGHGLASMRQRARTLRGQLQVVSNDGKGTTVILRVPLHRRLAPPSIESLP